MRHTRTVIRLAAWSALAASVLGVVPAAEAQANKRWMKINFYYKKANDAYQAKNWGEAIEYYNRYLELRPFDSGNRYNLACCYSLNKQTKEALDALEESIEYGWDDSSWMQQDSDLDFIEGEGRFAKLLKLADECRDEQFVLHTPRKLSKGKGTPLIVALHGFAGNPREFIASWKEAADEMRVVVVAPRGPVRTTQQTQMPTGWYAGRNPNNLDMIGA